MLPLSKDGFNQLKQGHPWIYKRQLGASFPKRNDPAVIKLGEHWFFYSPQSEIALRRMGPSTRNWLPSDEIIESVAQFESHFGQELTSRLINILETKYQILDEKCFRWIFSESDGIPGLIVDLYGDELVAQILTAPIEKFWPALRQILSQAYEAVFNRSPRIIERRDNGVRKKEGLPIVPSPEGDEGKWIDWNGFQWWITPQTGQKTGTFLDQKDNHLAAVKWAKKLKFKEAWDLCCYNGGFGLHLLKREMNVAFVDGSKAAIESVEKNISQNGLSLDRADLIHQDIFVFLREKYDRNMTTDMIILDPPSFAKGSNQKKSAIKGLNELNLRAMACLKPGGLLVTCSCSGSISQKEFREMLARAAHSRKRDIKILEVRGPSIDHAPALHFQESEYLQAWYLQVL